MFASLLKRPIAVAVYVVLIIILYFKVIYVKLRGNIRRVAGGVVVLLFILVVVLTIHSIALPKTRGKLRFCLLPSFGGTTRTKLGRIVFTTVKRTFFALDLKVNTVTVFKDCVKGREALAKRTIYMAILSALITLVTKFVVFPTYFTFGIRPSDNPDLVFVALPGVFGTVDTKEV